MQIQPHICPSCRRLRSHKTCRDKGLFKHKTLNNLVCMSVCFLSYGVFPLIVCCACVFIECVGYAQVVQKQNMSSFTRIFAAQYNRGLSFNLTADRQVYLPVTVAWQPMSPGLFFFCFLCSWCCLFCFFDCLFAFYLYVVRVCTTQHKTRTQVEMCWTACGVTRLVRSVWLETVQISNRRKSKSPVCSFLLFPLFACCLLCFPWVVVNSFSVFLYMCLSVTHKLRCMCVSMCV